MTVPPASPADDADDVRDHRAPRHVRALATEYAVGDAAGDEQGAATGERAALPSGAAERPRRRVAVLVVHGMGQQIPFQAIDAAVDGLRREAGARGCCVDRLEARAIRHDDRWITRLELGLHGGGEEPVEVHVYESYWAPFTEGAITLRQVIGFLSGAGLNGFRNGSGTFARWLFGGYEEFATPIRTVLYLLVALATVAALVFLNAILAAVVAGRALLATPPTWLTDALFRDLTTTLNVAMTAVAAFGASIVVATVLRRRAMAGAAAALCSAWGMLTVLLFGIALLAIILAAVVVAFLLYGHARAGLGSAPEILPRAVPDHLVALVAAFNRTFDRWAAAIAIVAVGLLVLWHVGKIVVGIGRDMMHGERRWLTLLLAVWFGVLMAAAALAGSKLLGVLPVAGGNQQAAGGATGRIVQAGLAWPLLVLLSAFVRRVLVQYLGDVAIYVAAHKLDGFFRIRDEIKRSVAGVLRAVYARPGANSAHEYSSVVVMAHSLGSVIAYDALNSVINEDDENKRARNVVDRTALFLTFGSPLDKTAFIFATQRKGTHEAREALAAAVQPLIRHERFRPRRWVNVYSPWDIISGSLEFYDDPAPGARRNVQNEIDPDATTLLAAHVEYWRNRRVFHHLYEGIRAS